MKKVQVFLMILVVSFLPGCISKKIPESEKGQTINIETSKKEIVNEAVKKGDNITSNDNYESKPINNLTSNKEECNPSQNNSSSQKTDETHTTVIMEKASDKEVITDIKNWNHPVKIILNDYYNFILYKVELLNNKTYPIFYMNFPLNLNKSSEFYLRDLFISIAEANGYWDYEIKDVNRTLDIKVSCDTKSKKVININFNGDEGLKELLKEQNLAAKQLTTNDFGAIYNNKTITINDSTEKLFQEWGLGNAKSDINAVVGASITHTFDRYEYKYPVKSSEIKVGVYKYFGNNSSTYSSSEIVYFNLSDCGTNRNISAGNSYFDLIDKYGRPNYLGLIVSGEPYCEYYYEDNVIRFGFDRNFKIVNIEVMKHKK